MQLDGTRSTVEILHTMLELYSTESTVANRRRRDKYKRMNDGYWVVKNRQIWLNKSDEGRVTVAL